MIKNCRPTVTATAIALLIVAAGQAHAQIPSRPGQRGTTDQSDQCTGAGLAAKAVACRAPDDPARSKYNLLYADDAPAAEDAPPSAEHTPSERSAGRTSRDGSRAGLRSGAADS